MDKKYQLEFLSNDVTILEVLLANRDGNMLVVPGGYMPDGKKFEIDVTGMDKFTQELRERCVQLVRSQYNAREKEQDAAQRSSKDANEANPRGEHREAPDGGGGTARGPVHAPDIQGSLEESLKARERVLREELEYLEAEKGKILGECVRVGSELERVELCIDALQTDSPKSSSKPKKTTEKKKQNSGSKQPSRSRTSTPPR